MVATPSPNDDLKHNQGDHLKGRTPAQALREAIGRKKLPPIISKEGEEAGPEAT